MTLKIRITDDMKAAMRAKDAARLSAIRLLLAAIKQKEVDERIALDDAQVLAIVERLLKQRRESIAQYEKAGREDLAAGERFDWSRLTGNLIRVRSGEKPSGAYVALEYRDHWFYIEDSDLESKTTFALLTTVLALQAGGVPSTGPVLTLPVSR